MRSFARPGLIRTIHGCTGHPNSISKTVGARPAILPNIGGSLPNDIFTEVLGLRTLWIPHSYPGCSQHAPNEHLPKRLLREGLAIMSGLYWDLGEKNSTEVNVLSSVPS